MLNESILPGLSPQSTASEKAASWFMKRRSAGTYWYALLASALLAGWMLRETQLVNPEQGLGYWLGITGASMMALLLLYPLRKKMSILRVLGSTTHWFKLHMILGLVGPLLVLYHCNFSLGSLNSQIALYCMLLVAGSGVIGRHFYAGIHRGLYGKKTSLSELQQEMVETMEANRGLAKLMPNLIAALEAMSAELQGDEITRSIGIGSCLKWAVKRRYFRFKLKHVAKIDLLASAMKSKVVAHNMKRLRLSADNYINRYLGQMTRVAQFSLYERLFSLWHVFHLPFFFMLVLSACVHVLAVHMY
jgi:hypothetical protein